MNDPIAPIVFVIDSGRSETTLLSQILSSNLKLCRLVVLSLSLTLILFSISGGILIRNYGGCISQLWDEC